MIFAAALAWPALAAAAPKRVGIPRFDGQQEALIRKVVMQIVKGKGFELVRSREIDDAAKAASISLDSNDGYSALAKELSLSAIVTGEVGKKKARLTVRNGADGGVAAEGAFVGPNPKKLAVDVAKNFWRRLGSAIERGKVPAGAKKPSKAAGPAAPEDNEDDKEAAAAASEKEDDKGGEKEKPEKSEKAEKAEKADKGEKADKEEKTASEEEEKPKKKKRKVADDEESSGGGGGALRYLDLAVGIRAFKRDLTYNQDRDGALRPYNLTAPTLGLGAVFYPGAINGGGSALANIGLDARAEVGFGLKSKTKSGLSYPTTVHDWALGLRYRIPFAVSGEFAFSGTLGEHAFKLSDRNQDPMNPLNTLPDTIYRYFRLGLFLRAPLGPASIYVGGAYRYILSPGQIKDAYFPNLSVGGIDAEAGLGFHLTPVIELRAGIDVRRYFYDFKVTSQSRFIVGGAIDQYITGVFMVAITLDGGKKE